MMAHHNQAAAATHWQRCALQTKDRDIQLQKKSSQD
jgi:hypothetical protein